MAERDLVIAEKVDYSGVFDYSGFYSFAHSWFKEEQYGVDESKYSEKVSGDARDIIIEWKASKLLSDYFKIEFKITFFVQGLSDVEVEIDGKKKKMNKGKIEAEIKGALVRDPDSKWDKSPMLRFFRDVYSKFIVPGRIYGLKQKVTSDAQRFKEELKAYLEIYGRR